MSLVAGSRIGPYEIVSLLGAGGMGEVYRARDGKLQRDVAIKILPPAPAADPDRLARFEREAQVLASLNHPNIAAIYGFEDRALVLELVEGPTLADRIAQGPIPIDEALPIARQIAEALEAAHDLGVIHRDLKPANIKLRADGTVKVLDFGLAKLSDPLASNAPSGVSLSPTITTPAATQAGVILGTAAYMSPEQARGKAVDKRADIWAFGCVLFEMLTGTRAFEDEDVSLTLSKVLRLDADFGALPTGVPPRVAQTIRVCLQKDPKKRAADMHDVRLALDGAFETIAAAPAVAAPSMPLWRKPAIVAVVAAAAALVVAGAVAWSVWPTPRPQPIVRFDYDVPTDHAFRRPGRVVMAFSPDGRSIVYNTSQGLYLRTLGDLEPRLIQGTEEDLANPFFSPDGQSVGYFAASGGGQLKRIAISGGAPVVVASATIPFGVSWAEDDTILFGQPAGIMRVAATGGTPELVIRAEKGEEVYGPQLMPDGASVLFTTTTVAGASRWDEALIVRQSLSSGDRTVLVKGGADGRYVPTGHLVYALEDGVFGVAFDPDRPGVSGGPVPLTQRVRRANGATTGAANYGISRDGTLVYVTGGGVDTLRTLAWIDRKGVAEDVRIEPSNYIYPRISPDGTRVALDDRNGSNDIWIWHFELGTRTRLVVGTGGQYPIWSADNTRILFDSGTGDVNRKASSNVGQTERLTSGLGAPGNRSPSPYFLSPGGTELVFRDQGNPKTDDDINLIELKDGAKPRPLLNGPYIERNAELSPNGRWMAYQSSESGRFEIYVRPFPNVDDDRVQVSNAGGLYPLWSRDGRELFYLEPAAGMLPLMSVAVDTSGRTLVPGTRTRLFDWVFPAGAEGRPYDVSPDGKRFLGFKDAGNTASAQIIVVEHWLNELKRLVPVN